MGRKPGPRSVQVRDARRAKVAELYLAGFNFRDIGEQADCAISTVQEDMAVIRQKWRETAVVGFGAKQDRELSCLDRVEGEAWGGWERSQQDRVKLSQTVRGDGAESKEEREGQAGDPRFLSIVTDCVEKRCKILGLFAAQEITLGVGVFHSTPNLMEQILARLDKLDPNIIETNGHHSGPISETIAEMDPGDASQGDGP